ncbi:MAG: hypothetical protein ACE366_14915 [Bradymonadia bacterium]
MRHHLLIPFCLLLFYPVAAQSHGPGSEGFPGHEFQLEARSADSGQLGVNFGLSQLLINGFNVAVEGRYKRWVFEYSHGMNLDFNAAGGVALTEEEERQNLEVFTPWSTGAGIGYVLLDELYLGAEFKGHRFEIDHPGGESLSYTTVSIGPVLAWRYFIWDGLHTNIYLRYWPNIWSSLDDDKHTFDTGEVHEAKDFGVFANVSLGWAFNL